MKHLFYIHSNITYLVAKAVINYHQLEKQRVVLLFNRNVSPAREDAVKYDTYTFPEFSYHNNTFKAWSALFRFKRTLREMTGGQTYFAYVPQTKRKELQVLIHNNACEGFSILEEGTDSYLTKENLRKVYKSCRVRFIDRLNYLNMVKSTDFFQDDYEHVYGINEHSFPGYDRKIVLDNVLATHMNGEPTLKNKQLLIFDGASIYNDISLDTHIRSIEQLLEYFISHDINEVYYKYHPSQINSEEEDIFESLLEDYQTKLSLNRLNDDLIIEHLIVKGDRLKFFVYMSSLGMYANVYGHEVYSFANFAVEKEGNLVERYPSRYLENVQFLS